MARLDDERTYIINSQERILKYVEEVKKFPYLKPSNFQSKSSFSGGSLINLRQDAKIMKLVVNGVGFHLTDLGVELLQSKSADVWRKAALNVSFFKILFEKFPNETDYVKIRDEVQATVNSLRLDPRLIGSVARRYLEYVYGIFPKNQKKRKGIIHEKKAKNYLIESFMPIQPNSNLQQELCTVTVTQGDKKRFIIYDVPIEKAKLLIE